MACMLGTRVRKGFNARFVEDERPTRTNGITLFRLFSIDSSLSFFFFFPLSIQAARRRMQCSYSDVTAGWPFGESPRDGEGSIYRVPDNFIPRRARTAHLGAPRNVRHDSATDAAAPDEIHTRVCNDAVDRRFEAARAWPLSSRVNRAGRR